MALTQKEILSGIDDMPLYQKDYDIINELLHTVDAKLFTKIVEEVLEGTLYWSDFEKYLSNTDYHKILEQNLELQEQLKRELTLLSDFRIETLGDNYGMVDADTSKVVLSDNMDDPYYKEEYEKIRDDIIFELTRVTPEDTAISMAFKIKLDNALRNGEYILEHKDDAAFLKTVDEKYIYKDGEKYDYINPDDIFLFIGSYLIPLDSQHQVLTSKDREFMKQNNLTEDMMRTFKSIKARLRRESYILDRNQGANNGG